MKKSSVSHLKGENSDVERTKKGDLKHSFKGFPFQIQKIQAHLLPP